MPLLDGDEQQVPPENRQDGPAGGVARGDDRLDPQLLVPLPLRLDLPRVRFDDAEPPPVGFGFSDTAFRIFLLMAPRRLQSDRFFTTDYTPEVYTQFGLDWIDGAYRGIGVPRSTPPEARKRMSDLWRAMNNDPEMKELAARSGFELVAAGRYGALPRNLWHRAPARVGNSRIVAGAWDLLDAALGSLLSPWCQNYYFVARRPSGAHGDRS